MKQLIALLAGAVLFIPSVTFAASRVFIDTTISNVNGGTLEYKGLHQTRLVTPTGSYSQYGTPMFTIPAGNYAVTFEAPDGYSESHSANCTGTVADGNSVHCQVTYTDGAPVSYGAATIPNTPTIEPTVTATPTPTPVATPASGLTTDQKNAIIGILQAFGVDAATITLVASYL